MAKGSKKLDKTKQLMAALVRMPPKPHEDMKVGKRRKSLGKVAKQTKARKKPGN